MPKIEMKNFFKNNEQIFRNKFHLYFLSFCSFIFMGVKKEVKMKEKKQKKKDFYHLPLYSSSLLLSLVYANITIKAQHE